MSALIIKLGALGDVVMATGLVRAILAHERGNECWLLTTPPYADLFAGWPGLRVRSFPRRGAVAFLGCVRWIRRQRFKRIYDLQANDRTTLLCALAGAAERIGNHPRFPYTHHPGEPWRGQSHIHERMRQVLAAGGVNDTDAAPRFPVDETAARRVADWLAAHGLDATPFFVLHAGASPRWPSKRWPHFLALAEALAELRLPVIWIGAGDDAELNRRYSERVGIDATDAFTIRELAELGRRAACAITNDSGPMHVLAAGGAPVYAFFGPTNWRRNHAVGQGERVLAAAPGCPACRGPDRAAVAGHTCLPGISVQTVLARLESDGMLVPR